MVEVTQINGRRAWLKTYPRRARGRRAIGRIWNVLTDGLAVTPLRSPPRHAGEAARAIERRRLGELQARGVRVPEVLAEGPHSLLLGDLGTTLSHRLKHARSTAEVDRLVAAAADGIARVHRSDAYLGQAVARNITFSDGQAGFLDFEEDPLEVMPLDAAHARDWLLFTASVARHYDGRVEALSEALGEHLPAEHAPVLRDLQAATARLGFLDRATRALGPRARALGRAVLALRGGIGVAIIALVLLLDVVTDGDSDILRFLLEVL